MHIIATESAVIRVLKDGTPLPPQAHLEEPDMDVRLPVFQKCEVLSCRDHGIPEKNYRFVKAMARRSLGCRHQAYDRSGTTRSDS